MHLRSIKLAGFKSFVDPTTIELHRDISVIVGPNGCGKSNILDAVRWVIGESAAQRLRGDVIADFVFSGSDTRAPAQRASVELLFDNSEGRIGGEYATYAELEVRRDVTSEGLSNFYLNSSRCRRRDIRDVFLGTGFGTRGYSIIQQDWITQLVNSDPETMREHLEEAAGVSKYRARRHETLNKLTLTETNLEQIRLKQEELGKTIRQLKTQATKARRFDEYSTQLNAIKAHLLQGRLAEKRAGVHSSESQLQDLDNEIVAIELNSSTLQERLTTLESQESGQLAEQEKVADARVVSKTQVNSIVNEIERLEQARATSSANIETKCSQLNESLQTLDTDASEIDQLLASRKKQDAEQETLESEVREANQRVVETKEKADAAQQALTNLVSQELELRTELATIAGTKRADEATIESLKQLVANADDPTIELSQIDSALEQTRQELAATSEVELSRRSQFDDAVSALVKHQEALRELRASQDRETQRIQTLQGELANCQAQLSVALDSNPSTNELANWLNKEGLDSAKRLGALLEVEPGWEAAIEVVLKSRLQGIVSKDFEQRVDQLDTLKTSNVVLIDASVESAVLQSIDSVALTPLASKLQGDSSVRFAALLDGVYACEKLSEARALVTDLTNFESIVTSDGVWLGKHWIQVFRANQESTGIIESRSRADDLKREINLVQASLDQRVEEIEELGSVIEQATQTREQSHQALSRIVAKRESQEALLEQYESRRGAKQENLVDQQDSLANHLTRIKKLELAVEEADSRQKTLRVSQETAKDDSERVQQEVVECNKALAVAETNSEEAIQRHRDAQLQHSQTNSNIAFLERSQERQEVVVSRLLSDIANIIQQDQEAHRLIPELEASREEAEQALAVIEEQFAGKNQALRRTRDELIAVREELNELSRQKDAKTEIKTQQTGKHAGLKVEMEQLESDYAMLGEITAETAASIDLDQDTEALELEQDRLTNRINQLGLINYRATSDLTEAETEKEELDRQVEDLDSAVTTLRNVLTRIDSETRRSLRTTFESVNENLARLFSQLFGGGTAFLEFTDEDILQSGVLVRARPPGKRISTISMLSGGERAMTAIAFVFALFELNPSPVCILDEVDAPLDERNVSKFAELLARMSSQTQFVVITHNPATMELAGNLLGVTMEEAGVSRLVAVDLEDAYAIAAN